MIFTGLVGVVVFASSSIMSLSEKLPLGVRGEVISPQLFGEAGDKIRWGEGEVKSSRVR